MDPMVIFGDILKLGMDAEVLMPKLQAFEADPAFQAVIADIKKLEIDSGIAAMKKMMGK